MSHVTHMHESRHTYGRVTSRIEMSHDTYVNGLYVTHHTHMNDLHVVHTNESYI